MKTKNTKPKRNAPRVSKNIAYPKRIAKNNIANKDAKNINNLLFIIGTVSIITIVLPLALWFILYYESKHGVSGTEFIGMLLLPIILIGYITALVNFVVLQIYLVKYNPGKRAKAIASILMVLSLLYICSPFILSAINKSKQPKYIYRAPVQIGRNSSIVDTPKEPGIELEKLFSQFGNNEFVQIETLKTAKNQINDTNSITYARLLQKTTGSLYNVETSLYDEVLSKNGYVRDGGTAKNMFYVGGLSKYTSRGYVVIRYTKNSEVVAVQYIFDRGHTCPSTFTCGYTEKTKPGDNIYPLSSFKDINVEYIDVRYANSKDNKGVQFDSEYY